MLFRSAPLVLLGTDRSGKHSRCFSPPPTHPPPFSPPFASHPTPPPLLLARVTRNPRPFLSYLPPMAESSENAAAAPAPAPPAAPAPATVPSPAPKTSPKIYQFVTSLCETIFLQKYLSCLSSGGTTTMVIILPILSFENDYISISILCRGASILRIGGRKNGKGASLF